MFDIFTYTGVHTWLSILGIVAGIVVVAGLLRGAALPGSTAVFLAAAVATSVTGFGFPYTGFLPSHGVGIVALVVLAVALYARYGRHLAGAWRPVYAVTAVVSLYLLVFVAIAQTFLKLPALAVVQATSQTPFAATQGVALLVFAALAVIAALRFRPLAARPA